MTTTDHLRQLLKEYHETVGVLGDRQGTGRELAIDLINAAPALLDVVERSREVCHQSMGYHDTTELAEALAKLDAEVPHA